MTDGYKIKLIKLVKNRWKPFNEKHTQRNLCNELELLKSGVFNC